MKSLVLAALFLGALVPLWSQENLSQAQIVPGPGTYEGPRALQVQVPAGATVSYRFLESPVAAPLEWPERLVLDALPGETRSYGLRLTTSLPSGESVVKDYRYQIVRPALPLASIQPEPGRYWSSVTLKPTLPSGWTVRQGEAAVSFPLALDVAPGQAASFVFTASGPQGQVLTWSYQIDRRDQEAHTLELLSPLEGTWANAQPLMVVFRGTSQVLWSYGDSFDPTSAREYTGPVILDKPGPQTVTVASRNRVGGPWLTRTVRWNNGSLNLAEGWPASGVQMAGLSLPVIPGATFSWDEGRSWQTAGLTNEKASESTRKVLSLQVKKAGQLYRYVYWLDARAPQPPTAEFTGGWNPRVSFAGSAETVHRVVWTKANGQNVEEPGGLWGPVGSWKVPDGMVAARIRTTGSNGKEGPSVSLGFSETGWSTPSWEPWDQRGPQVDRTQLPLGGRVAPRPGFWPVYTVSDRPDLAEPDGNSSLLEGAFLPTFPAGSDRTLYVRFAWRDAGGLVGPGSPPYAVRVDRVPPSAPDIVSTTGQVLVKPSEGEEEGGSLFWAVTNTRVASPEALVFQPYRAALDVESLRSVGTGPLWFHAQAQDRAGNLGPVRLNVAIGPGDRETSVVQVDPNPAVGEIPVENGGVYPWPLFRLRAVDQGSELWVAVTDAGSVVPADWKSRLQPWTGPLSRGVARGERRPFLVYWNAKTPSGWAWETPRSLLITLDLSAPSAPVFSGEWPTVPRGSPWTLGLRSGRPGDSVRYTFTLDGSLPADPSVGDPWPGSRTWDAPAGGRVQVRVRLAAVSVSGIAVEVPPGPPVIIDRSPPVAISPNLEPFTYRTSPSVIALPPGSGLVRYSLTSDGQLPPAPTETSELVPASGLSLPGRPGQSVLYRFWWRAFSLAGIPGPAAGPFGVLIDRTSPTVPATSASEDGLFPAPELKGQPASGLSAAAVTLTSDPRGGLLRFEVREGVAEPRPVTALSSLWTEPLVLDGGPGVDRLFSVSARLFSPEGRPLSPETSCTVRIDRSFPSAPVLELAADTRRPEAVLRVKPDESNPEETLYYRWSWEAFPEGKGTTDWTALSPSEVVFSAPGGALTRLRLEAYLGDEAGNRGPTVEKTLLVDQNVVYLSPTGNGDGTRKNPLGTVTDAFDLARREGKSIVLVAAGSYPVNRTLDLSGFRVYGGLSPEGWETTEPGRSLWTAAAGFQGTSVLESGEQDWSLSNIDVSVAVGAVAQVVSVKGAAVVVRNGNWVWSGAKAGWSQEGGSVSWENIGVTYAAEPLGVFLDGTGLEATVRGLRLAAVQNQGGVLFSLKNSVALLQDLVVVSKNARGFDGLVSAVRSKLTVDQARMQGGDGAERSTAFLLKDTEATLWNTEVSLYGSAANTGYQTSRGRLEVQKSSLNLLQGGEYNQGLVLDGTETELRSFHLKIDSASYQGGLSVDGGRLTIGSSDFTLAGGGQRAWGAQFFSEVLVNLDGVNWLLKVKTPGELWKKEKPWAEGSSVQGSQTGW